MSTKDIASFSPKPDQTFIMDTNILIKLFYPGLSGKNTRIYENFFVQIRKQKSILLMTAIQISEFINRCIRFQYNLWADEQDPYHSDFKKDYRNTDDYRESMGVILDVINNDISPNVTYTDDKFSCMDTNRLYQYGFSYDFNDALVAETTRLHNAILVTDDRDFANYASNIDIVTGNQTLLMFNKH